MLDEEEKKIKALELEHKEMMTYLHTGSWIFFTIYVMALVLAFSVIRENREASILMGVIGTLVLIIFVIVAMITWSNFYRRYANSAKDIRDQIYKLEEKEIPEEKEMIDDTKVFEDLIKDDLTDE